MNIEFIKNILNSENEKEILYKNTKGKYKLSELLKLSEKEKNSPEIAEDIKLGLFLCENFQVKIEEYDNLKEVLEEKYLNYFNEEIFKFSIPTSEIENLVIKGFGNALETVITNKSQLKEFKRIKNELNSTSKEEQENINKENNV